MLWEAGKQLPPLNSSFYIWVYTLTGHTYVKFTKVFETNKLSFTYFYKIFNQILNSTWTK